MKARGGRGAARPRPRRRSRPPAGAPVDLEPVRGLERLDRLMERVGGAADARYRGERSVCLRMANSQLYQPSVILLESLSLRIVLEGNKIGVATGTDLSDAGIDGLIARARSLAREAQPLRHPLRFREASGPVEPPKFSSRLEEGERRAAEALPLLEEEMRGSLVEPRVSGTYETTASVLAVANSAGLRRAQRRSVARADVLLEDLRRGFSASGWAEAAHWDPRRVDLLSLGRTACRRTASKPPRSLPPGEYRVLLDAPAVGELLSGIFTASLGARAVEEGWSFLLRPGEVPPLPSLLRLDEDPRDPEGLPESIDAEGTRRTRRALLHQGAFAPPCEDLLSAARSGRALTGNALSPELPGGPLPTHLTLRPGRSDLPGLLQSLGTGVLVTRFWYVRTVHAGRTEITGMTRDGTYWVEGGEISHPLRNLRFTESVLRTLSGVEAVGRDRVAIASEEGMQTVLTPALLSRSFRFTSGTTF